MSDDRNVLHFGWLRAAMFEPLEVPVDQRLERQQHLAQGLGDAPLQIRGDAFAQRPHELGEQLDVAFGLTVVALRFVRRRLPARSRWPPARSGSRRFRDQPLGRLRGLIEPALEPAQRVVGPGAVVLIAGIVARHQT